MGSKADALEIMNHKFFENFNWFRLLGKRLEPPYNPFA